MGDLIQLSERIADRSRPSRGSTVFFFAVGCPISYLAAETVERALGEVEWVPVPSLPSFDGKPAERLRHAEARLDLAAQAASELRLPLVAPEDPVADPRPVTRAAMFAGEHGVGAAFGLAAARLIFCGGFDPDDPTVIIEAASVAGLSAEATLEAAWDFLHDEPLDATARGLRSRGVGSTPAIRIDGRWFEGLDAVPGASRYTATRALYGAPMRPAG